MASRLRVQRLNRDFVKLRHKSHVFTSSNIAMLQSALDMSDLVSVIFLMCGNDQIENMVEFFSSPNCTCVASLDLYSVFQTFPEWERKLPEALGAIKNELALMKLGISPKDITYNRRIKDSELALCPTRVALYRIIDELPMQGGKTLITKMEELGAPKLPTECLHLGKITHGELLYFMFWHSRGFLNIPRRENFEIIATSLRSIGKGDLADYFISPQVLHDSFVFDDHPLGVYPIKDPKNTGLCVIINQVKYGGKKIDRESSIVNLNELLLLMSTLNFSVVCTSDLTEPEFCERIKTSIVNNFSAKHSIFMLIIMGHGGPEGVFCPPGKSDCVISDLKAVRIEDIQDSLFLCKELEAIPKVLILNSCRGKFEFTTRDYFQMAADAPYRREIVSHVDIITCYSALPHYVSWRDPNKGSLFMNLFCEILRRKPDMEICELFTLMNARLMQPTADMSVAFTAGYKGHEDKTALPFDFTSSLRKKLYFKLPEIFTIT